MIYVATVSASNPGAFRDIVSYRGDLGTVRAKAARKVRQWKAQAALRGCTVRPTVVHPWGESFEGATARGAFLRVSVAVRVGTKGGR